MIELALVATMLSHGCGAPWTWIAEIAAATPTTSWQ